MTYGRAQLLGILPLWLRQKLEMESFDDLEDIRLRSGQQPELIRQGRSHWIPGKITQEDLQFCINAATRYSPWNSTTAASGYITAPGGHRIGICGDMIEKEGQISGLRHIFSLCIRVAKDYPGIGDGLGTLEGSILILGPPGSGKTTLMRDLIRQKSNRGIHTAVADERGELFPPGVFPMGKCTDVMTGCAKSQALDMLLRTMGPQCVAMDEITSASDCEALIRADHCGVSLLATAHAGSLEDLRRRPVYTALVKGSIFQHIVVMQRDKRWRVERSLECR